MKIAHEKLTKRFLVKIRIQLVFILVSVLWSDSGISIWARFVVLSPNIQKMSGKNDYQAIEVGNFKNLFCPNWEASSVLTFDHLLNTVLVKVKIGKIICLSSVSDGAGEPPWTFTPDAKLLGPDSEKIDKMRFFNFLFFFGVLETRKCPRPFTKPYDNMIKQSLKSRVPYRRKLKFKLQSYFFA